MTAIEQAMNEYYAHFGAPYPYAVGIGFMGETDEENIRIIREAIATNTPVVLTPCYGANRDYDMDIGRQIFCEEVLNRFVEIRTPEDCRRFAEWYFQRISDDNFPVERLNTIYTVWEYIQMQQYNEALIALPIARKNWEGGQNAKVASPEERQQTLDAFRKTELLLESKEYATLQQQLQKRIEYSKSVCEDYFKNG